MAKKDFEWNSTQQVGVVDINDKKQVLVQFNSLIKDGEEEESWYVSLITMQFFKKKGTEEPAWNFTKNASFPMETWQEIADLVAENLEEEEE